MKSHSRQLLRARQGRAVVRVRVLPEEPLVPRVPGQGHLPGHGRGHPPQAPAHAGRGNGGRDGGGLQPAG